LAKNCHPKKLRRHVLGAELKWSLLVSRQFCSEGRTRISHSRARSAALPKSSGSSEVDNPSRLSRQRIRTSRVSYRSKFRRPGNEARQLVAHHGQGGNVKTGRLTFRSRPGDTVARSTIPHGHGRARGGVMDHGELYEPTGTTSTMQALAWRGQEVRDAGPPRQRQLLLRCYPN
jgi:hypothetical protein